MIICDTESKGLSTLYTGPSFNFLRNRFRTSTLKPVSLEPVSSETTCRVGFKIIIRTSKCIFDIHVTLIRIVHLYEFCYLLPSKLPLSARDTRVLVSIWGEADVQNQLDGVSGSRYLASL